MRGEEWISSTPKHVLLYDWLGWERPKFAHMPLLRNTDKSKISKRKNPAARLTWFLEQGYLPEALRNFLALMGYSQPDGTEVFTFDDMVRGLRLGAGQHRRPGLRPRQAAAGSTGTTSASCPSTTSRTGSSRTCRGAACCRRSRPDEQRAVVRAATPLVNERMQVLSEAEGMLGFLLVEERDFHVDVDDAGKVLTRGRARRCSRRRRRRWSRWTSWTTDAIEAALRAALVDGLGLKPKLAFGPVRVAATGRRVSPPLFESLELLGRDRSLNRLRAGLALADE